MSKRLIVALDVDTLKEAIELVDTLKGHVKIFKIGSVLFTRCGPEAVRAVRRKGVGVFLDLKFHDIPNTVRRSAAAAEAQGVSMFTVHACGGQEMMVAARQGAPKTKILAVTVLTSQGRAARAKDEVLRLARAALDAGLDGVVASAQEVGALRKNFKRNFLIITPGIRPRGSRPNDQRCIAHPKEALAGGADYIVVGRPIIEAGDPLKAAKEILCQKT